MPRRSESNPRRLDALVRVVAVAMVVLACSPLLHGHGNLAPGPPQPPIPPGPPKVPKAGFGVEIPRITYIYPQRWSWLHWWEANRDPYLMGMHQGELNENAQGNDEALRGEAITLLTEALEHSDDFVRAHAALALGRMHHADSLDRIRQMAEEDSSLGARVYAKMSLGLLESDPVDMDRRRPARDRRNNLPQPDPATRPRRVGPNAGGRLPGRNLDPSPDMVQGEANQDLIASVVGAGLKRERSEELTKWLERLAGYADPGTASVANWALRTHLDGVSVPFLIRVLERTDDPWLASDAILSLGRMQGQGGKGDPKAIPALAKILLMEEREVRNHPLPSISLLGERELKREGAAEAAILAAKLHNKLVRSKLEKDRAAFEQAKANRAREYERFRELAEAWNAKYPRQKIDTTPPVWEAPELPDDEKIRNLPGAPTFELGLERIYIERLRVSAAIALGQIDHPKATEVLLRAAARNPEKEYRRYYEMSLGFVLMSLAEQGSERALPVLLGEIGVRDPKDRIRSRDAFESPRRGYAALALGLYARPFETEQGPADRKRFDAALDALANRLSDSKETPEVRAAAAMGLGLSRRTVAIPKLRAVSKTLTANDEVLGGYLLVARGMLGDVQVIEDSPHLLKQDKADLSGILARRGAVLGLGLLGSSDVIPVLQPSWDLNFYVSRETLVALGLCRGNAAARMVIDEMKKEKRDRETAFFAQLLGEIFMAESPTRLSRINRSSNYTMRNEWMNHYQAMGNQFMFEYLIPAFPEQWR